jgi:hypothetical protein
LKKKCVKKSNIEEVLLEVNNINHFDMSNECVPYIPHLLAKKKPRIIFKQETYFIFHPDNVL